MLSKPGLSGRALFETILSTFLGALLIVTTFAVSNARRIKISENECAKKKWLWIKTSNEIEFYLHRWEIDAATCLKAGFLPVFESKSESTDPNSPPSITIYRIEDTQKIVDDMATPNSAIVGPNHLFSFDQEVLICDSNEFIKARIKSVSSGSKSSVIQFDSVSKPFPKNAVVVGITPVDLLFSPSTRQTLSVDRRIPREGVQRILNDFQELSIKGSAGSDPNILPVTMKFSAQPDCKVEETLLLRKESENGPKLPKWIMKEGSLEPQP